MDDDLLQKITEAFATVDTRLNILLKENKELKKKISTLERENNEVKQHINSLTHTNTTTTRSITQIKDKLSNVDSIAKAAMSKVKNK